MTEKERGYALADQEGQAIWLGGSLETMKAKSEQTHHAYGLHVVVTPPGAEPPAHIHRHQDEAFYVLEGAVSVRCGEQVWHGETGTFVFLPKGVPHAYKVEGTTPLKMLVITSPGGPLDFEQFVEEMGEPAQTRSLPTPKPLDIDKMQRLATKYGIEFVELS
ncbi:MAG: cupin domain-containing protein [Ktedonobacteraceae bacterium]|nr:cupin domain-containing protein [Ktedonobacteraceae bacterium]